MLFFFFFFVGENIFQPISEKIEIGPFVDVPEHESVLFVVDLLLFGMGERHDGIGILAQMADPAFVVPFEAHVGDEVEVRLDADPVMGPDVQVDLVVPIGSVALLDDVEAVCPVGAVPRLFHVAGHNVGDFLVVVLSHGVGEILPAVTPGGEAPAGGV